MHAGGVHEGHSKTNGQVEVAVVLLERTRPNGHVKVASGVVGKRRRTNRHVILTGSIVSKRIETHGGIVDPAAGGIDAAQHVNSQSCVSTCATPAWALCFERRRKRKAAERNCHCKKTATQGRAVDGSYQSFHLFVYFVGCCPVERVNCPPARAKPKIIRRNAIPKRGFSFIWLSPGSSCLRSREAPVQRRSS